MRISDWSSDVCSSDLMSGKGHIVGQNNIAAELAIMRQMHISHDPVIVSHAGDTDILAGSDIESNEFAYRVAIADFQPRRFAGVFFVLRCSADRCKLKNRVVATDTDRKSTRLNSSH